MMKSTNHTSDPSWLALLVEQHGAFARNQAVEFGITDSVIRAQVAANRWQRVHPRTYVAHNGELEFLTRVWAAVLFCGPPALVSHRTAAYLAGLLETTPTKIDVSVPMNRRPRGADGIVVHRRQNVTAAAGWPPRVSTEDTVLDLIHSATRADDVVGLLTSACQRRLSTASRLRVAAARRQRLAWRSLVNEVLSDADDTHSPLEWRYLKFVERAHGLPEADRQVADRAGGRSHSRVGRSKLWRDVIYSQYKLVVELDGSAAHPPTRRHRDMARDNDVIVSGGKSLRYGWQAIAAKPCETAEQVATVLQAAGWTGNPRSCGAKCKLRGPARSL
jgi:hypothetical protein